jgi:hypothetical protein
MGRGGSLAETIVNKDKLHGPRHQPPASNETS